jgi:hypothetical protein
MKTNELIEAFANAKVRTPESVTKDVKTLLPLKVEELVNPVIFEEAETQIAEFDKIYSDFQSDISDFAVNIDKQTAGKRAECEELKREKSRVVSNIASIYGEGGDGSKIYAKLAEVDSKLQNVESFLFEIETLKKYPTSDKIITKAKTVFEAGKTLIKFLILKYQPEEEKLKEQYKNLTLLLRVAEGQLSKYHFSLLGFRENQIDETFGRTIPTIAAEISRDELRTMARVEIEKALSS